MRTRILLGALTALSLLAACGGTESEPLPSEQIEQGAVAQFEDALCAQTNYLQNPEFDTVGPNGSSTTITTNVGGGAGYSAAASWTLFTNTPGTLNTQILPSTRVAGGRMIRVTTQGNGNGLVQVFQPFNSGPTKVISGAWIYVLQGKVGIGTGNGGNTGIDAVTQTVGQWEYVQAANGVIPANEFIIYSVGLNGADFYVDSASVKFSPNLLSNPTFATVGPNGSSVSVTTAVPGSAGWSAAQNWAMFTNNAGPISSELVPSTLPGGVRMIHVVTQADRNGISQVFGGASSCTVNGPAHAEAGAWIYVLRGRVGIGTGNGGNTGFDAYTHTTGQWEWVQAKNGVSPANTFIIYAATTYGADFYVGFARVNEVP